MGSDLLYLLIQDNNIPQTPTDDNLSYRLVVLWKAPNIDCNNMKKEINKCRRQESGFVRAVRLISSGLYTTIKCTNVNHYLFCK